MALNPRSRLNLALLALVALLGAFAYFRPGLKAPVQAPPVAADAMALSDVRIALAGKPEIHLVRKGEAWRMQAPLDFPADDALMQGLLDSLAAPLEPGFPAAGTDLAKYGLDKPLARLWLDGKEYAFGLLQPVSKQRYVLHGDKVRLVDDYVFYRIAHDTYWWLDKRLVPEGARITALQLPHATLTQDPKGTWQLAPANKDATPETIQTLVDAWQDAYAMGMAPIGKGKRLGEVALSLAGAKEPLRFLILDDPDYLILARPDLKLEYQVDISRNDALLVPGAEP
ncbi:MAG TPA: DUF4340 domain-containing protein [Gammaproteobacteria bacterium]|jgi:hypothetical protein|nr:DUF4340 domain-containing protein [Gammaproteobacteria bacterium]